ncbi:MAG: rod shape-determining protein MreD [Parashewanella sp.]
MNYQAPSGRIIVWFTFIVSLILQVMPLPEVVKVWRPDWLLLTMICWAIYLPHRYGVITAFALGVVLDILLGATIGVRALAFSITIYLVMLYQQRLINFPRWKQSLIVFVMMIVYHSIVYWVELILGETEFSIALFYPALSGIMFWRWAYWMIRRIAQRYRVS